MRVSACVVSLVPGVAGVPLLADIPIVLHPGEPFLSRALDLCLTYRRRPYDALFVALAEHLEDPLITGDLTLVRGLAGTPVGKWVKAMTP